MGDCSVVNFESKIVLITGASQRIGQAIALTLAKLGMRIALHYHHSAKQADQTLNDLTSFQHSPNHHQLFHADLSQVCQIKKLVADIESKMGQISVLVNNAAVFYPTPFEEIAEEQWDHFQAVNLKAPFFLAQAVAKSMRFKGEGKIINIVDSNLQRPAKRFIPYTVSKSGLLTLNAGLAKVLAPKIQVNAIAPGPSTPLSSCAEELNESPNTRSQQTLLQKIGSPQDIANAVVYLLQNDLMTGSVLTIDGGASLV